MLLHRGNARVQIYMQYFFLPQILPASSYIWAQAGLFAATSLILDSQYMYLERIILAHLG